MQIQCNMLENCRKFETHHILPLNDIFEQLYYSLLVAIFVKIRLLKWISLKFDCSKIICKPANIELKCFTPINFRRESIEKYKFYDYANEIHPTIILSNILTNKNVVKENEFSKTVKWLK